MTPTLIIDDTAAPGAWTRAIARGCLATATITDALPQPLDDAEKDGAEGQGRGALHVHRNNSNLGL